MKHCSLCPICGDEKLHEVKKFVTRSSNGHEKRVPYHVSICSNCECETLTEKQALFNKRAMTDFYREADGLLTGSEIKQIRISLGLTQEDASKLFGGGKTAFTKYEKGDVTQSVAMDKLIRTAKAVPQAFEYLCAGCPENNVTTFNVLTTGNEQDNLTTFDTVIQVTGIPQQTRPSLFSAIKCFVGSKDYENNYYDSVIVAS